jgi:hypothetical protein
MPRPPFTRATWLRIAFAVGAVVDALALGPLLSRKMSTLMWSLPVAADAFMRGYAATLMVGWTLLLAWAFRRPLARAGVAALTAIAIHGLVATEIVVAATGGIPFARVAPTLVLQALLVALFAGAYHGRPRVLVRASG